MKDKKVVVFDLDDTLIKERDFLKSAYKEIADFLDKGNTGLYKQMLSLYDQGENVFGFLEKNYSYISIQELLQLYHGHYPDLNLADGALSLLNLCKNCNFTLGLITDGRSITQRNKLKAAGIEKYFDKIIISEEFGSCKPSEDNFKVFEEFVGKKYYIGDNPEKDFITPNAMGWETIGVLGDDQNIHKQAFDWPEVYLPKHYVKNLSAIPDHW